MQAEAPAMPLAPGAQAAVHWHHKESGGGKDGGGKDGGGKEGGGKEGGGKEGISSSSSSSIGGGSGCDGAQHWPHGGFAYFYDERDAQHDCVFAVASVASADAASLPVKRTSSSLQQQPPSKKRHAAARGGAR